jgi:hypothetical protein
VIWLRLGVDAAKSLVSALVALLAAVAVPWRWAYRSTRPPSASTPEQVAAAARMLAVEVLRQWRAEARVRRLLDPEPLRVQWQATGGDVTWMGAEHIDSFVRDFLRPPNRRLVLLGESGTGKTSLAVLLTLAICEQRGADDPVPVPLSPATWDAAHERLDDWIQRRLTQDYPALRDTNTYGATALRDLVADRRVLPVLDGLDELPEGRGRDALIAINETLLGQDPILLTCRTDEYHAAVDSANDAIRAATVMEPKAVRLKDAIDFLRRTSAQEPRADRWSPLFEHLRRAPEGPLAVALSTPLMVSLLRAVYAGSDGDPRELTDFHRFPDRAAIENHLIGALVPTLIDRARRLPGPGERPAAWDPIQTQRWLTFLATHLHRLDTRDLAWWQLREAVPLTPIQVVAFAATIGLAFGAAFGIVFGPLDGFVDGLVGGIDAAIYAGLVFGVTRAQGRGARQWWARSLALWLGLGVSAGLAAALVFDLALGPAPALLAGRVFGLWGIVAFGFVGVLLWHAQGRQAPAARSPAWRWSRPVLSAGGGLLFAMMHGLVFGLAIGLLHGPAAGLTIGWVAMVVGLLQGLGVAILIAQAPAADPTGISLGLRGRRHSLVGSLEVGLGVGLGIALAYEVLVVVSSAAGIGPGYGFTAQLSGDLGVKQPFLPPEGAWPSLQTVLVIGLWLGSIIALVLCLQTPTSTDRAVTPRLSLRNDRAFTAACVLTIVLAVGLADQPSLSSLVVLVMGLRLGLVYGLLYGLLRPWPSYVTSRTWLALRGELPWRPQRFFEAAHRLGILRRVGAVYQFRHARLQDHLARPSPVVEPAITR